MNIMHIFHHTKGCISTLFLTCIIASLFVAGCVSPSATSPATTPQPPAATTPSAPPTTVEVTEIPAETVVPNQSPVPAATPAFKSYSSSQYGFSIDYPGEWEAKELNEQETAISLTRIDVVEFYSPAFLRCNTEKTECVNVRAEVKVEAETNPSSTDLDTFFVKEVARVTTTNNVEITKRDAMFKLAGDKAYRLDYKSDSDDEDINALSAYTIKNGVGYIITYHAHAPARNEETNQFEQYYNDAMSMFSSFTTSGGTWKTI